MKMTKTESEAKVYALTERLLAVKRDQKDTNAGFKDVIKDIESEIKAVIEDFNSNSSVP